MKAKHIKEALENILKPKNLVGRIFYAESSFVPWPVFVFKIIKIGQVKRNNEWVTDFKCEVIFNLHSIEGPTFYKLYEKETFYLDHEDLIYYEFKEYSQQKILKRIDEYLSMVNSYKNVFENLKDE